MTEPTAAGRGDPQKGCFYPGQVRAGQGNNTPYQEVLTLADFLLG